MSAKRRLGDLLFDTTKIDGREDWWDGWTGIKDQIAAALYVFASLGPLIFFALCGVNVDWFKSQGVPRLLVLVYGASLSLAPHLWLWAESSAFFNWSKERYKNDEAAKKEARDLFKVHADGVKAVWAGIIALYVGVLLKFPLVA